MVATQGSTPKLSVMQAAFIGVGAMVGAGIFSLLGAAGEVAGAAVWLSFLIAGAVALLQGYSFGKLGARYPTAGGMLEYVSRGFGDGHTTTGIVVWLLLSVNAVITVLVLTAFVFTTLVEEPATALALACILGLSVGLDWWWKRIRDARPIVQEAT